jgi:hypothetical protein
LPGLFGAGKNNPSPSGTRIVSSSARTAAGGYGDCRETEWRGLHAPDQLAQAVAMARQGVKWAGKDRREERDLEHTGRTDGLLHPPSSRLRRPRQGNDGLL